MVGKTFHITKLQFPHFHHGSCDNTQHFHFWSCITLNLKDGIWSANITLFWLFDTWVTWDYLTWCHFAFPRLLVRLRKLSCWPLSCNSSVISIIFIWCEGVLYISWMAIFVEYVGHTLSASLLSFNFIMHKFVPCRSLKFFKPAFKPVCLFL